MRGTVEQIAEQLSKQPIKGECILMIQGNPQEQDFSHLTIEEHISQIEKNFSISRKDAIKIVAEQRRQPKRLIYNQSLAKHKKDH